LAGRGLSPSNRELSPKVGIKPASPIGAASATLRITRGILTVLGCRITLLRDVRCLLCDAREIHRICPAG
jgi:hypothetical protein